LLLLSALAFQLKRSPGLCVRAQHAQSLGEHTDDPIL
jgi:hypothetical protein